MNGKLLALLGLIIITAGGSVAMYATRGLRNNNPLNIRRSNTQWLGMSSQQNDQSFVTFSSMEYGIRAAAVILKNYQRLYGLNTVRLIINRWAPPGENDTESYISFVAGRLGVQPDEPINVVDRLPDLIGAMARIETGTELAASTIDAGVAMV